jgi:hypothetical protein
MERVESIQQLIRELQARVELLAEQVPRLEGKRLRDAERELRALQLMIRHYEGKLASRPVRMPMPESNSSGPDSLAG